MKVDENEFFRQATLRISSGLDIRKSMRDCMNYLHREMMHLTGDTIIGAKFGLKEVMRMVEHVAPTDSPVLIMGETDTGKELIANAIHFSSKQNDKPFIKVNCGAIPDNLIDSELFGHEKGAFTGAISKKKEAVLNGQIAERSSLMKLGSFRSRPR